MTKHLFAFVLMPFADEFNDVYRLGIQETAKSKDVIAQRVDDQIYTESILAQIYRQIEAADFIIADMTGRNANVFYEVGYAHAKEKICTLITRSAEDIPFDLKHHRHLVYDGKISRLRELLSVEVDWIRSEIEKRKTSAFEIKFTIGKGFLEVKDYKRVGTLDLTFDVHNRTSQRSPEIDAVYIHTSKNWELRQSGEQCAHTESEKDLVNRRHILASTTKRLAAGGWMQVRCEMKRDFWIKWVNRDPPQSAYHSKGFILLEISTDKGSFEERIDLDVTFDEFPF